VADDGLVHGQVARLARPLGAVPRQHRPQGSGVGSLVGEQSAGAAMVEVQHLVDQADAGELGQAQRQLPVLEIAQGHVEAAGAQQVGAPRQPGGGAGQAAQQQVGGVADRRAAGPDLVGEGVVFRTAGAAGHQSVVRPKLLRGLHQAAQVPGQPFVVAVVEGDPGTPRLLHSAVARRAGPAVARLLQVAQARIGNGADQPGGVVGGAVVHHDQLDFAVVLVEHAGDGPRQRAGAVVGGQHDADEPGHVAAID
jgi:hypothetical protein